MALARLTARLRHGFWRALTDTLPIPARLRATLLESRLGSSIFGRGMSARPDPRCLSTGCAAVTAQGMGRRKRAFTPSQQTTPPPSAAEHAPLKNGTQTSMLRWAQGSGNSPTLKSRSGAFTPLRDVSSSPHRPSQDDAPTCHSNQPPPPRPSLTTPWLPTPRIPSLPVQPPGSEKLVPRFAGRRTMKNLPKPTPSWLEVARPSR